MRSLPLLNLTRDAFSKYGRILEPTAEEAKNPFIVLEKVVSNGWQMAYSTVTKRSCDEMRRHTNTKETFEPLQGTVALVVALPDKPEEAEVFLLDRPVVINEGVWHNNIAISETAHLRINENIKVVSESHRLSFTIKAELYAEKT